MGGIGKTTLARKVYNKIVSQFESSHFLNDVREQLEKRELTRLRQELVSVILDDDRHINLESTFTKSRLHNKKILIVFDDVTCSEQIKKLIGDLECFGPGSRIFITSRDKQVLKNCGVGNDNIYEVKGLLNDPALQLFSRHAFKLNHPTTDYIELSQEIVRYAKGIPLALEVLGGLVFGKTKEEWESAVRKLERNPDSKISDVLRISYDGLDEPQKTVFLDVACFLKGVDIDIAKELLDANGLDSEIEISTLIDKSLISVTAHAEITMHDLLQEMGKKIVNEKSKDPGKRSRLWHHEDIYRVLKKNMGTEAIEGIRLDMSKIKDVNLKPTTFLNMQNVRFFDFCCCNEHLRSQFKFCYSFCSPNEGYENKVHAPQGLEFPSTELSYFRWFAYPLTSVPTNFDPENLIALCLPYSNIQILNVVEQFDKLKYLDLSFSKQLIRISDLSLTPNLQFLILKGCTNLIEVSLSIQHLKKLVTLDLSGCKSLCSLPTCFQSKSLTYVNLYDCSNLERAPMITCNMEVVYLDGTSMIELPLIEYPSSLKYFHLQNWPRLESIPSTICNLKSLDVLCLRGFLKLNRLPDDFGSLGLSSLEHLDLSNCQIINLPESLGQLCNLKFLILSNCKRLQFLSNLPSKSDLIVCAYNCTSLEAISDSLFSKLVIFLGNCSKLDQNMLKTKVENTLSLKRFSPRDILFPGNEIPKCFSFQSMGSSITLNISPYYTSMSHFSVALCIVVTFQDNHKVGLPLSFTYKLMIRDKYGKTLDQGRQDMLSSLSQRILSWRSPNLQSDHVILGYDATCITRVWDDDKCCCVNFDVRGGSLTFDFYSDSYEVKKCGVMLLRKDASFSSDEEDDEEGEEEEQQPRRQILEAPLRPI